MPWPSGIPRQEAFLQWVQTGAWEGTMQARGLLMALGRLRPEEVRTLYLRMNTDASAEGAVEDAMAWREALMRDLSSAIRPLDRISDWGARRRARQSLHRVFGPLGWRIEKPES